MKKFSIEYAHIYVDEIFDESFIEIANEVKRLTKKITTNGDEVSLCVMIDDYNPIIHRLKIDEFIESLEKEGVAPDFVIFESELIKMKKDIMAVLRDGKIKRYYEKYINTKNHFPCSFLIAVWYLMRLGVLSSDKVDFYRYNKEKEFVAEKLVNVLQSKYTKVEDKAREIIESSTVSERLSDIEYKFVE